MLVSDTFAQNLPYRLSVGIMLINGQGKVWVGRRLPKWARADMAPFWQMPQGGIHTGEHPEIAALRELFEESGATTVTIIGRCPQWLTYDLPAHLMGVAMKGRYRGQKQLWFATQFLGSDSEIDISPKRGCKAEFDAWKWIDADDLPNAIVAHKRGVYETVLAAFRPMTVASTGSPSTC